MGFNRYSIFIYSLFLVVFGLRWIALPNPLPTTWTPESKIRFTATITESVEYTDSQTIMRYGIWYIKMRGYAVIIPGSRVSFVGTVMPKLLGNKVTQIVMVDPTFEVVDDSRCVGALRVECGMVYLGGLRDRWVDILEKTLPEPMSSLAAGILLGVKSHMPQDFYEQLVSTGTLHIVAASGFNVSIVATVLMNLLSRVVSRGAGIVFGIMGIVVYVLIAGGSASVVRAGIMGSLTLIAYYFGRPAEAKRLLWITGAIMLLIDPLLIADIGFQLSFAATAGMLYIEPYISTIGNRNKVISERQQVRDFLKDYFYPTLAATCATLPFIFWHFGRISFVSPIVNVLVLPVVPLVMLLTSLIMVGGQLAAYFAYLPLWWIVRVIELFG
jgi:ComEC/Rec2-related protein